LAAKIARIAASSLLVAAALLGYLALRAPTKAPEAAPMRATAQPSDAERAPVRRLPDNDVLLASRQAPLTGPSSEALPGAEPRHPHPITPQHERIYRENALTFSLDGAVDAEDVPAIRRSLAIYRQEFPEDSLVLQGGYEVIANCLEKPGESTRAAAQRFYDTELASALRRHVRRHCLEKP
jgi:hypothetical protein